VLLVIRRWGLCLRSSGFGNQLLGSGGRIFMLKTQNLGELFMMLFKQL
jgi:hypothetical protein